MKIKFWKITGAGNDFIGIHDPDSSIAGRDFSPVVRRLCHRRFGIGADGVIVVQKPEKGSRTDFRMRYFNADGSEAETCGNGARCCARLAHHLGVAPADMTFDTNAGVYHALLNPQSVIIEIPPVEFPQHDIEITSDIFSGVLDFIKVGVPHVVVLVDDLESADVKGIGRSLRYYPRFDPPGTNVNFVSVIDNHTLAIRTYERGVENETLACGTGCLASAICLSLRERVSSPVRVITRSGISLELVFTTGKGVIEHITMTGPADIICEGEVDIAHLEQQFPQQLLDKDIE